MTMPAIKLPPPALLKGAAAIRKFNPNHDERGRFTFARGAQVRVMTPSGNWRDATVIARRSSARGPRYTVTRGSPSIRSIVGADEIKARPKKTTGGTFAVGSHVEILDDAGEYVFGQVLSARPGDRYDVRYNHSLTGNIHTAINARASSLRPLTSRPSSTGRSTVYYRPPTPMLKTVRGELVRVSQGDMHEVKAAAEPFLRAAGLPSIEAFLDQHFSGIDRNKHEVEFHVAQYSGDDRFYFGATVIDRVTKAEVAHMNRDLYKGSRGIIVHHARLEVGEASQGKGFIKDYMPTAIAQYRRMQASEIHTYADIDVGGYAWARYGFLPQSSGEAASVLEVARKRIASKRWPTTRAGETFEIPTKEHKAAKAFLATLKLDDPLMLWKMADSKWGKAFLINQAYEAIFDLKHPAVTTRYDRYVQKKQQRTRRAQA